jgi:diadenosine tetraphosphate (Ap4A) HIT family hydrolase
MDRPQRTQFLSDMALIGDALLEVTGAYRINYEILGNLDPALHAHIIPRYLSEPDERRQAPPLFYDKEYRNSIQFDYGRDRELIQALAAAIQRRL